MRVLLHNSHHQTGRADGWSGAPGEAAWVMALNDRIEAKANAVGIAVARADGDLADHPQFHSDYDLFDAPHYEANLHYSLGRHFLPHNRCGLIPEGLMRRNSRGRMMFSTDPEGHVGGWLWGRAGESLTALLDDKIGRIFQSVYVAYQQAKGYDLPFRDNWNNVNITDYYGFRLTSASTAGWLTEHGVGAPGAPDHDWLFDHLDDIAGVHVNAYLQYAGLQPVPETTDVHLFGQSSVGKDTLLGFARKENPAFSEEWVDLYLSLSPFASMRVEFPFAQMLKETDYGRFTGIAKSDWNNPAGLGVTGSAGVGNRFLSKRDGVVGHLQHLLFYLWGEKHAATPFCTPLVDQRHTGGSQVNLGEHRMLGNDITLLNAKWATPGLTYGNDIAKLANDIRIFGGHDVPDETAIQKMIDDSIGAYGNRLQKNELEPQVFVPLSDHELRIKKLETTGGAVPHQHTGTVTVK